MTSLDIGCGYPNPQEPYTKRGDIGVDLERGYADVIEDALHLPFKSGCFSRVSIHSSIDHFSNPVLALKEAYRVCTHTFILSVSNCDFWARAFSVESKEHFFQWNIHTMKNLLSYVGFKVKSVAFKFEGERSNRPRSRVFRLLCRILFKGWNTRRFFYNVFLVEAQK